jgi:predicted O-methyltransferase YrrM
MSASEIYKRAVALDAHAYPALLRPDQKLDNAIKNSAAHNLPNITVSSLQGQYLSIQCQLIGAKSVLEIGTLGGYSTIWFARTGAKVTSIEIDPRHRDIAVENTKDLDGVEIILGAALDVMPKLVAEGRKFDLVFLDASWDEQTEYFKWATKLIRDKGCIYVDNVVRNLFEDDNMAMKETLLTSVGKMDNVTATLMSTVSGHKGTPDDMVDGFLLAIVNEIK